MMTGTTRHANGLRWVPVLACLAVVLSALFLVLSAPAAVGAADDGATEEPSDEAPADDEPEPEEDEPAEDDEEAEEDPPAPEPSEISPVVWVGVGILVTVAVAFAIRETSKAT